MELDWKRKGEGKTMESRESQGVHYLAFPMLEETGLVRHGFATRLGGVGQGQFATMNFSFSRGDDPGKVMENYKRMAGALRVDPKAMVLSCQTHKVNVARVEEGDAGRGLNGERAYQDVDGLITQVPGITLVTFYADCVPLYFLDPVSKAIGLSHSGWRGTVQGMGRVTLEAMAREFGTRPGDVLACIGPSICQDCYQVGEDVAGKFQKAFARKHWDQILAKGPGGKYQLDLWKANEIILLEAGVLKRHLEVTDICTCCNSDLLFSHRAAGEARGNLAAFLSLGQRKNASEMPTA